MAGGVRAPVRRIQWRYAFRIVSSRYPPVGPFDEVADPNDLDAAYYTESLTNSRLRVEWGELNLVPPEQRISGPGTTPIMAAFTHPSPDGSRFSNGSFGVYYAAHDEPTAIEETVYHRERFLHFSREPPTRVEMRQYVGSLSGRLVDLRGLQQYYKQVYSPNDYTASRQFGIGQRRAGALGIVYDSVRRHGGQCAAIFTPGILGPVTQSKHYYYLWNGARVAEVLEVTAKQR